MKKAFCTSDPRCTRDFRVKMWGTSSPEDKLAGNLGNVIGAISTGGRRVGFFYSRKLAPSNFGLLQQYRHIAVQGWRCLMSAAGESGQWAVEGEWRLCPVADLGGVGIPQRSKPLTESIRRTKSDGTVATVHSALMFASRMMATETSAGRLVIPLSTGIIGSFADNRSRIG